jgi:hypothetical protein
MRVFGLISSELAMKSVYSVSSNGYTSPWLVRRTSTQKLVGLLFFESLAARGRMGATFLSDSFAATIWAVRTGPFRIDPERAKRVTLPSHRR